MDNIRFVEEKKQDTEKKTKYSKYEDAIKKPNILPWLLEKIKKSNDKIIRIRTRDLAENMGKEFANKNEDSIYWALKSVLFHKGIVVNKGRSKRNEHMLIMRERNEEDKLPPSLVLEGDRPDINDI